MKGCTIEVLILGTAPHPTCSLTNVSISIDEQNNMFSSRDSAREREKERKEKREREKESTEREQERVQERKRQREKAR